MGWDLGRIIGKILLLFGKKAKGHRKAGIAAARKRLEGLVKEREKKADNAVFPLAAEAKHEVLEIRSLLSQLEKEENETGAERTKKIVDISTGKATRQLESLTEKIMPPQFSTSGKMAEFSLKSAQLIDKEILKAVRNVIYATAGHKSTMKEIGTRLETVQKKFLNAWQLYEGTGIVKLEAIAMTARDLEGMPQATMKLENEKAALERNASSIREKKQGLEAEKSGIENSEKAKAYLKAKGEITKLEQEKELFATRLATELGSMEKPAKKLQNLAASGNAEFSKTNAGEIRGFIESGFALIKRDPKGQVFKNIAMELKEQLLKDAISVKDRQKTIEALDSIINADFFGKYFWQETQIEKSLALLKKESESASIEKELNEISGQIRTADSELAEEKKGIEAIEKRIAAENEKRGKLMQELSGYWKAEFPEETLEAD